ncbi:hypothetical protein ACFX2I_004112 [Malus domestica]
MAARDYNAEKELYAFDDLKIGVKGLADSGVTKIPRIFFHPPESPKNSQPENGVHLRIPIVNHGVPLAVMEEMLEGIRKFHGQPPEAKRELLLVLT